MRAGLRVSPPRPSDRVRRGRGADGREAPATDPLVRRRAGGDAARRVSPDAAGGGAPRAGGGEGRAAGRPRSRGVLRPAGRRIGASPPRASYGRGRMPAAHGPRAFVSRATRPAAGRARPPRVPHPGPDPPEGGPPEPRPDRAAAGARRGQDGARGPRRDAPPPRTHADDGGPCGYRQGDGRVTAGPQARIVGQPTHRFEMHRRLPTLVEPSTLWPPGLDDHGAGG